MSTAIPAVAKATIWSVVIAETLVGLSATNWLELDEGYRTTPCHAGLYLLPALLADAEAEGTSLADLLHALAVGYEVITRIARAFAQEPAVMQSHGRFAALGAAVAMALHRRLPAQQLLDAASAAFEVGYESASQFSREYGRLFGQPPIRDVRALRSAGASAMESDGGR